MSEHPSPPDPLHEVLVGRLWQSGSRLPEEEAERFDAIVMVGEESQPWLTEWMQRGWTRVRPGAPRLPLLVHAPLIDADGWLDAATATATARYVRALLESGRRVLIHCDGGAFRSPFLAALVLAEVEGIPGLEALRRVDALRGRERRGLGYPDYDALLGRWPEKPSP